MTLSDELSSSRNAVTMIGLGDVLAYRPPRGLLHGRALERCSLSQSVLFFLSQPERHSHPMNGISQISHCRLREGPSRSTSQESHPCYTVALELEQTPAHATASAKGRVVLPIGIADHH